MAEEFAFGGNSVCETDCPAQTFGHDVSGPVLTVAERYDRIVRERYEIDEGTLPASIAESCWSDALDYLRESVETNFDRGDYEHAMYLKNAVKVGEEIERIVF